MSEYPTVSLMDAEDNANQGTNFPPDTRFKAVQCDFPDGQRFVVEFDISGGVPKVVIHGVGKLEMEWQGVTVVVRHDSLP